MVLSSLSRSRPNSGRLFSAMVVDTWREWREQAAFVRRQGDSEVRMAACSAAYLTFASFSAIDGSGKSSLGIKSEYPDDDCQQIVKVVRHTSCQKSNRLHFLRLLKLFFKTLAHGNVARDALDGGHPAVRIQYVCVPLLDPDLTSIAADAAQSGLPYPGSPV